MPTRLAFTTLAVALLIPAVASADHYFVFPQVGIGYGRLLEKDASTDLGKLDVMIGQEYDTGGPRAAFGWMLDIGYASNFTDSADPNSPPRYQRAEIAPMLTLSSGYNWWTLFARIGVGPHFVWAERGRSDSFGGGAQIDMAIGVKNAIELFTQAFASHDGREPNLSVVGGLRINAIAFVALLDLLQGRSPRMPGPQPVHHDVHHAVPVH